MTVVICQAHLSGIPDVSNAEILGSNTKCRLGRTHTQFPGQLRPNWEHFCVNLGVDHFWVRLFFPYLKVSVTHYLLYCISDCRRHPSHWHIEGSNDAMKWTPLSYGGLENERDLMREHRCVFQCDQNNTSLSRYIHTSGTGENCNGSQRPPCLSGFDLFGSVQLLQT